MSHKENCLGSFGYVTNCNCFKKCSTEEEAMKLAKEWAKTEEFVTVIESGDGFFVETQSNMIRSWERLVWRHSK